MSGHALGQVLLFVGALLLLAVPLGRVLAKAFQAPAWPLERRLFAVAGVDPAEDMPWQRYTAALLVFNLLGGVLVYALQRLQALLPMNPLGLGPVSPAVAFNTAVSFVTNTNWQAYSGETTMSFFTQLMALTVQNFVSAATGLAVLVALARGFVRVEAKGLGNFWLDLWRGTVVVLLPLSLVLALALVSQGVVQTFQGSVEVTRLEATALPDGGVEPTQVLALGPVASQEAIKQLGTNGGGFFNANSAHPFENPTPLSNFLEWLAILLVPAALCLTFGRLVKDPRQGRALLAAMTLLFVPFTLATVAAEEQPNPRLAALGVTGPSLEGKEVRFGPVGSALWAAATTAASNGSVNAMHDSFSPLGGLFPMWLMQLGEVVFGGVGSGLYGLLLHALLTVFISGLMVGRTPEYLGKKIEAKEMKLVSLAVLLPSAAVLVGTALACALPDGRAATANPGAHGFSELLYAFSSGANNNGSAFAGLTVDGTFFAGAIGLAMLIGRYWVLVPVLAIAGSLAAKKSTPVTSGTLPTHGPLFVVLLCGVVVLVGALTFVPALALGPLIEHLQLHGGAL
jgi:K+-transporting ATPase ATPase A chain